MRGIDCWEIGGGFGVLSLFMLVLSPVCPSGDKMRRLKIVMML